MTSQIYIANYAVGGALGNLLGENGKDHMYLVYDLNVENNDKN